MILFKPEHVEPILAGRKTQTRRLGKRRWKVGAVHQCATRLFDPAAVFARVRVVRVRRQHIRDMTSQEARAEGYPGILSYREAFFRINRGLTDDPEVWVVEFELTRCPDCHSEQPGYRNPIGNHADEDSEPDYEWCVNRWHEPFYFTPPLQGQEVRA